MLVVSLSVRTVDEEAEADVRRFVAEEVAEESPVRTGARLGVWAASLICDLGEPQGGKDIIYGLISVPVKTTMQQIAGSGGACARRRHAGTFPRLDFSAQDLIEAKTLVFPLLRLLTELRD